MDLKVSLYEGKEKETGIGEGSHSIIKYKNSGGMSIFRQGRQLTGTIVSVSEQQITLDFDGQKASVLKNVLQDAVIGETKTFEVLRFTNSELILRLLKETTEASRAMKASMLPDTDWETVMEQKRKNSKQSEIEQNEKEIKSKLEEIGNKLTQQDYAALEAEGFAPEGLSVEGLYDAVNRIKETGSKVCGPSADVSGEMLAQDEIAERLKAENLPATTQNILNVDKALALSETASKIDDKAMKYLISQGIQPTVENIYKACYSSGAESNGGKQSITEETWSQLSTQVEAVIKEAGCEVNEDNMKNARWLVENGLALTAKTFLYKKELDDLNMQTDRTIVLDRIIEGMKTGTLPQNVILTGDQDSKLKKMISDISTIQDGAVTHAVHEREPLTLRKLTAIQADLDSGKIKVQETAMEGEEIEAADQNGTEKAAEQENTRDSGNRYEEIKAQRQLEEIRLKMTLEAARRLEGKGISIDTEKLSKIVEELRELENDYYRRQFTEAGAAASEEALQTLKATTEGVEQLKSIPCAVLGSTLSQRNIQTIPALLEQGSNIQAELIRAGTAYEALMTVPNREYGDSIQKAFTNMDSLLSELNMENTVQNQRAVRVLSYNQMEITSDNIEKVKNYDGEVTALLNNLHPAVTVRMIKEGINPMKLPISELNDKIDEMKEEQGITTEDKFSTYLQRLDRSHGISEEERKEYIGIYRLLYNVEKSDGAVLGAVIKAGRSVTLSSLLTAVQTERKGSLDAIINDEFGTLSELTRQQESISEQLGGFGSSEEKEKSRQEDRQSEQNQYLGRILKQVTGDISPERLNEIQQNQSQQNTAQVLGTELLQAQNAEKNSIWESVKDIPLEQLLQQLQSAKEGQEQMNELYTQRVEQLRQLSMNCEQSIRFLNDNQITSTPQNIMLASQLLSNGATPIVKLIKRQSENSTENSENSLKNCKELSDKLIDKTTMNEAYEALEATAKEALEEACSAQTIDSRKLAQLKSMGLQMTFLRTLAQREYYQIPIETANGITNINLTILRGKGKAGQVTVAANSDQLGSIKSEFIISNKTLRGFISCNSKTGLDKLQVSTGELAKAAEENGLTVKQIDFALSNKEKEGYRHVYQDDDTAKAMVSGETERMLYGIAKAFIQSVRAAEYSTEDIQKAVS